MRKEVKFLFAEVILKTSHPDIDRVFDYKIPIELLDKVVLGMRVSVPFGRRNTKTEGYVVKIKKNSIKHFYLYLLGYSFTHLSC